MKKYLFLILALLCMANLSYASFPVTEKFAQTEVVSQSSDEGFVNSIVASTEFKFGGFLLGLLLGLIGVLLAYIFSDDRDFIRSAWYGVGTWIILYLVLFIGVFAAAATV